MTAGLRVTDFDLARDDHVAVLQALEKEIRGCVDPLFFPVPLALRRSQLAARFARADRVSAWVVAERDGEVVALAGSEQHLTTSRNQAWVNVGVLPRHRRQGIGSAVLQHVEDQLSSQVRQLISVADLCPHEEPCVHAFAAQAGFEVASTLTTRRLMLPVSPRRVAALEDVVARRRGDYRVSVYVDGVPHRHVRGYLDLLELVRVDSPAGGIVYEPLRLTPHDHRSRIERLNEQGEHHVTALAFSPSGEVVALSVLHLPADRTCGAQQSATYVHRQHRGHRLGLATKLATLRTVTGRGNPWIVTTTDDGNATMTGVNEAMGFTPFLRGIQLLKQRY